MRATAQAQHSEEIPVDKERAKRLMAMGEMAASLAHEIRNPLGSMELYCTLLKKDLIDAPDSLQLAEQIHSGIRRLDRIITNCLQFSRDFIPKKKVVGDTAELFHDTLEMARSKANAANVEISFEELGEFSATVDSHLVNQAVLNLLLNAIEACDSLPKQESPRSVILFSDRRSPLVWKLSVRDAGPGIPAEERERVFDPFVTTKTAGTGLGLAIVSSIAMAHGGSVIISDDPLGGSCVTIEFPTETN